MKVLTLVAGSVLAAGYAAAAAQERFATTSLPLYHRFLSSTSTPAWTKRGTIHLDTVTDEGWIDEDGDSFNDLDHTGDRYQIGILRSGDDLSTISSVVVDSCVLLHPKSKPFSDNITLFFTSAPENEFLHFRYSTNSNQACGPVTGDKEWVLGPRSLPKLSDVEIDRGLTLSPILFKEAPPVVIDEEGKIVKPPPEKTFLEKYWMYIIPAVLILVMGGGEDDKGAK